MKTVIDKTEVYSLLDRFLEERRLSEGGWAPVSDEDKWALTQLLNELIRLKFQRDPDGDLPVQFKLIDRNVYRASAYRSVPYEHKDPVGAFRAAFTNLRIAIAELDSCETWETVKAKFS